MIFSYTTCVARVVTVPKPALQSVLDIEDLHPLLTLCPVRRNPHSVTHPSRLCTVEARGSTSTSSMCREPTHKGLHLRLSPYRPPSPPPPQTDQRLYSSLTMLAPSCPPPSGSIASVIRDRLKTSSSSSSCSSVKQTENLRYRPPPSHARPRTSALCPPYPPLCFVAGNTCMQLSRSSSCAMAASPAENHRWSASSYPPPGLLVLNHPSQEFRSPDDGNDNDGDEDGAADGPVDATRRRSSARGLERRDAAWTAGAAGSSAGHSSLSGEAAAVPVARTGRDAAAVASRRAPQQGFSPPSPRGGSPPARPNARSRPLASTPMPAMGQAPLSSRRPRRDVARPVSYEEPSLSVKMRK